MTPMLKPCRRITCNPYRITVSGATVSESGRKLVAELAGDQHGDLLRLREAGRRTWVTLSIPDLYRRGLLAQVKKAKKGKRA
jgi:hypothetical protein